MEVGDDRPLGSNRRNFAILGRFVPSGEGSLTGETDATARARRTVAAATRHTGRGVDAGARIPLVLDSEP
jgi:hypothetical protein